MIEKWNHSRILSLDIASKIFYFFRYIISAHSLPAVVIGKVHMNSTIEDTVLTEP